MPEAKKLRPLERVELLRGVAQELANRFSGPDIDNLLERLGIEYASWGEGWQVDDYAKHALRSASDEALLSLADELQLDATAISRTTIDPPAIWRDDRSFRLFISHRSQQKEQAIRLREALAPHQIACFVAHEDIEPTADWQREIERALRTADAMLALVAEGFSASPWTQQEIGWMHARRLKVISFKYDGKENPKGFIARDQSIHRKKRTADQVAEEISDILTHDPLTGDKLEYYRKALAKNKSEGETAF